jgi:hypothetical protein
MSDAPPTLEQASVPQTSDALLIIRGLAGAIAGGALGYFAFRWLWGNGLYAIMLVGVLMGIGAGLAARGKSVLLGILCAILALPAGILTEWHVMPFVVDGSLPFFLKNLAMSHWLFICLGAAGAFWFGQGR